MARPWLYPLRGRAYAVMALVAVLAAAAANYAVRDAQYRVWQAHPQVTLAGDMPLFSTADAPHFLMAAETLRRQGGEAAWRDMRDAGLLPVIIAHMAKDAGKPEIVRAGQALIPFAAAVTAVMVAFAFGMAGYWLEGAVAALGGGLSFAYLSRSAAGRIDTDQMNLGFFHLLFGLACWAGLARTRASLVLATLTMGAAAFLFNWWYGKPEMIIMPIMALGLLRLFGARDPRGALVAVVAVVGLSGIAVPDTMNSGYIQPHHNVAGFQFPNILNTVSEVQVVPLWDILPHLTGNHWIGVFCLFGLAGCLFRHPMLAMAYAPLAGFALLNFVLGNRALFYSAPVIWFGGAWLVSTLLRCAWHQGAASRRWGGQTGAGGIAAGIALFMAYAASPRDHVPQPSFSTPIFKGFMALQTVPANATIASWWDYGHLSRFLNGRPVLDAGSGGPQSHFLARALISDDMRHSAAILRFLVRDGMAGLAGADGDVVALDRMMAVRTALPAPPVYLVLTGEMADWLSAIDWIASWNIEGGAPGPASDNLRHSTYARLFFQNRSGDGPFDLVYDDYPHIRVFRLRGG